MAPLADGRRGSIGFLAVAASLYMVYVLEILKLRGASRAWAERAPRSTQGLNKVGHLSA